MKQRVAQLEAIILRLHGSDVFTEVSAAFNLTKGVYRPIAHNTQIPVKPSEESRDDHSDGGGRDSDTEDAALVLEELGGIQLRERGSSPSLTLHFLRQRWVKSLLALVPGEERLQTTLSLVRDLRVA